MSALEVSLIAGIVVIVILCVSAGFLVLRDRDLADRRRQLDALHQAVEANQAAIEAQHEEIRRLRSHLGQTERALEIASGVRRPPSPTPEPPPHPPRRHLRIVRRGTKILAAVAAVRIAPNLPQPVAAGLAVAATSAGIGAGGLALAPPVTDPVLTSHRPPAAEAPPLVDEEYETPLAPAGAPSHPSPAASPSSLPSIPIDDDEGDDQAVTDPVSVTVGVTAPVEVGTGATVETHPIRRLVTNTLDADGDGTGIVREVTEDLTRDALSDLRSARQGHAASRSSTTNLDDLAPTLSGLVSGDSGGE